MLQILTNTMHNFNGCGTEVSSELDLDWTGLDYSKFCWIWIGSGLWITSKFRIRTSFRLS